MRAYKTFQGAEMHKTLVKNKHNRAVDIADLANNEWLSVHSLKRGSSRVNSLIDSIRHNGWKNSDAAAYQIENGDYVLLNGNTRKEAIEKCLEKGILEDYPVWDIRIFSDEINPNTGKKYTFEEAMLEVEFDNIHAARPHTATDIIEEYASKGYAICQEICKLAKEYNVSTVMVGDMVSGIKGSSKEENVKRLIEMPVDYERVADIRKIINTLDTIDKYTSDDVKSLKKCWHVVDAFFNVYFVCKDCGVENEFCDYMMAVSKIRRPNPFLGFFDDKKVTVFMHKILYLVEGFFEKTNVREIAINAKTIIAAFEKYGYSMSIARFHQNVALGRTGVSIEKPKKNTAVA